MYSAINHNDINGLIDGLPAPMNINLLVNTHGKICLVHDEVFQHIPLWIKHKKQSRQVEILFDNGALLKLPQTVPDTLRRYLETATKVNVIRTENNLPVEGWETFLLNDDYN